MKYAMVIDLDQCVGCETCTIACKLDNETGVGIKWGRIIEAEEGTFPDVRRAFVPLLCMQCEDAQCISVCPTGASYRNSQGLVQIDYSKCVGCKYCIIACPFMARQFNDARDPPLGVPRVAAGDSRKGVVEKCDFCSDRLAAGREPVCVESCPYEARIFGDLDDANSRVGKLVAGAGGVTLKPDAGSRPSVYYIGVR